MRYFKFRYLWDTIIQENASDSVLLQLNNISLCAVFGRRDVGFKVTNGGLKYKYTVDTEELDRVLKLLM